jgi:glycosyltransferase involved in cell wall biosynthesis
MKKINISCVITTHNRDEYLKGAIYSALNQTHPPIEIVISNNIPNKKTQAIVELIAEKSSVPIHYIEHSMKGQGAISANLAVSKCEGDFIAFLMDDDLWEIRYLEKMSLLISEKNSKIVYAWLSKLEGNNKTPYKQLKEGLTMKDLLLTNPGCGLSNLVVDKELFIGLGGLDDCILSDDKDFLIRAIYYDYKYHILKDNLVIERKGNYGQLTDINKNYLIGMKKFFKKHESHASPKVKIQFWIKYWKVYLYWKVYIKILGFNKNKIKS